MFTFVAGMMITDGSKIPTASYFNSLSETNTIQKTVTW